VSQQAFASTHVVPAGGLAAYERADPTAAVVANLEPNLEVYIAERLGDWARIVCSNGWGAWVDGRQLVSRSPATAAPSRPKQAFKPDAAIAGAALIAVGAFLPWIRGAGGLNGNAFDLPASMLWSSPRSTSDGPFDVWILLAAAAVAGVVFSLRPDGARGRQAAGIVAIAIAALFVLWLLRLTSEPGVDVGLLDLVSIGPPIILSGGVLLVVGKVTR
jgi:hypothetical protein